MGPPLAWAVGRRPSAHAPGPAQDAVAKAGTICRCGGAYERKNYV